MDLEVEVTDNPTLSKKIHKSVRIRKSVQRSISVAPKLVSDSSVSDSDINKTVKDDTIEPRAK